MVALLLRLGWGGGVDLGVGNSRHVRMGEKAIIEGQDDGLNLLTRGDVVGFEEMTGRNYEETKEVKKLMKVWHTTRQVGSTPC
jgi:hypothetical protein